jgi:hypothetical protein
VVTPEGYVSWNKTGEVVLEENIGGAATTIYLFGGNVAGTNDPFSGLYVDNVTLTEIPGDSEPPSAVTGLTVSNLTDTSLELSWDPSTDDLGVVGYRVISEPDLGEVIVAETGVTFTELDPETEYAFTVTALDEAGNESDPGDPLVATTKETIPPYFGPDYYVDPELGSMEGNGSLERPWSTLQEVFEADITFEPGDIIYLRSGLHGIPHIDGMNEDYVYIMPDEDAEPRMIRLRFASTSSHWDVTGVEVSPSFAEVFERSTMVEINGSHNILSDSNIYSFPDSSGWGRLEWINRSPSGVSISAPHSLMENCVITNVDHGISVKQSANHTAVRGNHIQNFVGDGIRGLADYSVYEYNYIADCYNVDENHDDGFQSWSNGPDGPGSGTVYRITLRGNIIVQTTDLERSLQGPLQAIGCFGGMYEDWVVENNVIATNHWHGITFFGAINCRFVNNTVVDIRSDSSQPWIQLSAHKNGTPPSGNLVRNNITTSLQTGLDQTVTIDNNMVISSTDYETLFVDHPYDLRLRDGSAAIDAGSNVGAPSMDAFGLSRPYDGNWDGVSITDLGAFEYRGKWIHQPELGWLYTGFVEDRANMWIYSLYLEGWAWSNEDLFPIVYEWSNNRWVYWFMIEDLGTWLFDYASGDWTHSP